MPLQGPAYKGHPWPFKPLAASLRLVPLRNTSTRPTDGDSGSELPGGFLGAARIDRSHAPRGNAAFSDLRQLCALCCQWLCDEEHHEMGTHAKRGYHRERITELSGNSKRPLQEAERNRCVRG